jgi:hypothetical protein
MKRQFTGGDPKVYKGIEKDFLEIARLVLAVKHASNAAARLGVPRDLTDAYWNRADSISRPTWRRFEVLATARRQGFLPPILTNAVGSTRWTLPSDGKAKSLRGQTAEDIASLKRLGEELVTETTMLATNLGDDYGDAAWWKDFLDAKREVHSEDGGWSAKQSRGQSRMDQLVPDLMAVAASRDTAELRYMRAVRGLVLIGLFFFPPFRNQLRHLW